VVEAARMNLMGMAEEAVDVLHELLQPGTSEAIRLKAAENILNRSGVKEALEMKVEVTNGANPSDDIFKKLQIMRERTTPALEEDIIDAEDLVDEGEKQPDAPLHVNKNT
jgi:hypothetical protein